jgi:hypothetical protein
LLTDTPAPNNEVLTSNDEQQSLQENNQLLQALTSYIVKDNR